MKTYRPSQMCLHLDSYWREAKKNFKVTDLQSGQQKLYVKKKQPQNYTFFFCPDCLTICTIYIHQSHRSGSKEAIT